MTRRFCDNLNLCFSKALRRSPSKSSRSPLLPTEPRVGFSSSPRYYSSGPPLTLVKSYNSVYDPASDSSETGGFSKPFSSTTLSAGSTSSPDSDDPEPDTEPDLASVYASRRFFFSCPGHSNSIVDEQYHAPHPPASVAVPKMSPDPFIDFRRSMEEMILSQGLDVRKDWDDLRELLLCYLALNRKPNHKYILGAFADLLVSSPETAEGGLRGRRRREVPRRRGG